MTRTVAARLWAGGLVLGLGLGLGACHKAADGVTVRLRYWGDTEEIRIIEGLLQDFEAAHPGVHVKPERKSPDASYLDTLLTEFAGGIAPDVIFTATEQFDKLAEGGRLADLGPWLEKESRLNARDYYPSMVRRFSKDGHLLALPRDIAPMACIYYNQDLFDAAGLSYPKDSWTWDDLRRDALKLTVRAKKDSTAVQLGFADDWNLTDAWVCAGGGRMLDDPERPSRFTFAEGGALKGILFRWQLLQKDRVMPSTADIQVLAGGPARLFVEGKLGMFHSGLWKTPGFRKEARFRWDVAPFPRLKGVEPSYWSGGSGYAIRQGVADPDLCWQLVKYLAGPEGQQRMAATGLAQPSLKAMAASPVFLDGQDPKNKKMLLRCAERAVAKPSWPSLDDFGRTLFGPVTDPIWIHGYKGDPGVLLKDLQRKANATYFKRPVT